MDTDKVSLRWSLSTRHYNLTLGRADILPITEYPNKKIKCDFSGNKYKAFNGIYKTVLGTDQQSKQSSIISTI
jgi:hypothetical protein